MFYILFNNEASKDIGLHVEHRPIIPVPEQETEYIRIEGRDGSLSRKKGYKDITIPIQFGAKHNDLQQLMRNIKAWLLSYKNTELILSDDFDYFYKVKAVKGNDIERELRRIGKFTVEFVCDPFQYMKTGKDILTLTTPGQIYNPGTRFAQPAIKIYGTGDVIIGIGNETFAIKNLNEYIEVNSVLGNVYKGTVLATNQMSGDFPILEPGEININWSGNITKIEITPNWRCL